MDLWADTAQQYVDFLSYSEADSACFAEWSHGVIADSDVLAWLAELPPLKQQPNLVYAAARWAGVPAPGPYAALRAALLGDDGSIRNTILTRSTQTNEVGRLATLTPALARVATETDGPLALIEVGASAGLCLYPDRYDYDWPGHGRLTGSGGPTLRCEVAGPVPVPDRHPTVAWRGGIDLNPLDVRDEDAMAWLTTLVWPEQDERRDRLTQAIDIARRDPPALIRGNLLEELPAVVDRASAYGRVVVFHSAVIAYLDADGRNAFQELMDGLVADGACRWISNEAKPVLPQVTATSPPIPDELATFVLALDGQALAWTHGHGSSMTWLS